MMLIVVFFCHFICGYFHSFYFFKLFHYVCVKCVHGFGKTKARTKPNQNPQYVLLQLKKKGGRSREAAETSCPALSFWQICNSQTRGDAPPPSLTSCHPSDTPVLPAGSPPLPGDHRSAPGRGWEAASSPGLSHCLRCCKGTDLCWSLPLEHLALFKIVRAENNI